jgi:hypothetical protein
MMMLFAESFGERALFEEDAFVLGEFWILAWWTEYVVI